MDRRVSYSLLQNQPVCLMSNKLATAQQSEELKPVIVPRGCNLQKECLQQHFRPLGRDTMQKAMRQLFMMRYSCLSGDPEYRCQLMVFRYLQFLILAFPDHPAGQDCFCRTLHPIP